NLETHSGFIRHRCNIHIFPNFLLCYSVQQPLTTQQPPPRRVRIQDWKDVAVKILKRDN
ncbi:hypothetical protein S245_034453, partial [Arachis hypogaea]